MHGVLFVLLLHYKNIMSGIAYTSDCDPEPVVVCGQKVIRSQGHECIFNAC